MTPLVLGSCREQLFYASQNAMVYDHAHVTPSYNAEDLHKKMTYDEKGEYPPRAGGTDPEP